ncbi:phage tail protein [Yersinia sp. 1652 StPb PI]|uniref:phage tail protein n=1 Tax=unclassified Yersinia (in: enterobacteria) TaxID=2653513 RepID=UPI00355B2802
MSSYFYSQTDNSFYPVDLIEAYQQASSWPEDGIEVSEDVFITYSGMPPEGKMRGTVEGMPAWLNIPPSPALTADELAAKARSYRDAFIIATDPMMVSDYCIDDTPLTQAQRTELTAIRSDYRAWPTRENWPLIDLPELPQWLLIEAVNQGYRVPDWPVVK